MSNADDLERIIACLDTLYEQGDDCIHPDTLVIVSDGEYDAMRRELAVLRPNSVIFNNPTASSVGVIKKIKHNPPMTSISKASHEDRTIQECQLFKWLTDCSVDCNEKIWHELNDKAIGRSFNGSVVKYPDRFFYQSYKLDGVACAIYYKDGNLVAAGLRPRDGVNGEDVTDQIQYVSGVPKKLNIPLTCSIRGELICKLSDFEKVQEELEAAGEKLRANPRNHAAGGIRQFKDPIKVKSQKLSFIGYAIEGLDNPPYETEVSRAKWCNKDLGVPFIQVRSFNFYDLQKMEDNIDALDYEVDGVVIGVNNLEDQEQLGRHGDPKTGNPKGKIAWKFAEERATPKIKSKDWKTGRTGAIKPVANFDAVPLAGTQVSRATLHNLGFIYRNKIQVGTQIIVLKAGKIIPKVVGVLSGHANYKSIEDVDFPRTCPSCNCKTIVSHTPAKGSQLEMHELTCPNKLCPAQNVSGLCHYLKTFGVLGLGESKVSDLVEGGSVKTFVDFYRLNVSQAMSCGLSERQALLAIAGINLIPSPDKYKDDDLKKKIESVRKVKKSVPLWKLFASFGIESAGKSAGKALVDHFGSFDAIRASSVEELASVENVGEKTAQIIFDWLKANETLVDDLLMFIEPELPKIGSLTGKTFVLTGTFPDGKAVLEKAIEAQGGVCSSSVSKNTSYVVVGIDAGSKEQKADKLGIEKLNVDSLKKLLG